MKLLDNARKGSKPGKTRLQVLSQKIDIKIDQDWWGFITQYDGVHIDFNRVDLALWTVDDVINLNPYFTDDPLIDNYLFFADNGSSTGYAFDKINGGVVAIDYYNWGEVEPQKYGSSFKDFLDKLSNEPPSGFSL
jgi:hypothetical protein